MGANALSLSAFSLIQSEGQEKDPRPMYSSDHTSVEPGVMPGSRKAHSVRILLGNDLGWYNLKPSSFPTCTARRDALTCALGSLS